MLFLSFSQQCLRRTEGKVGLTQTGSSGLIVKCSQVCRKGSHMCAVVQLLND